MKQKIFLIIASCFLIFPFFAQAAPETDSMLGYWKFDGNGSDSSGDGSTVTAFTMYSHDTSVPTTAFANSRSVNFSGTGSSATFANQNNLKPTTGVSLSLWVYLNAYPSGVARIGNYVNGSNNAGFSVIIDASSVYFSIGNGSSATSAFFSVTQIPVATWTHLTGTWDGSMIRLYKNGTLMNSTSYAGSIVYSGGTFQIRDLNGKLDDLRLYSRALTVGEIADLAAGYHTEATWIGGINENYGNFQNWNTDAVPDPYTRVILAASGYQPVFSSAESMASLTINSGTVLDIQDFNLTINDGGVFSNTGTLALDNFTQTLSGFTNDTNSGIIRIDGPGNVSGLKTGNTYYDLIINSVATVALNANLAVNGNLTLQSGTLDVTSGNRNISLKGDWVKNGGNFLPWSGTVTLNGTTQSIVGSNTFYNLSKSVSSSDTLTFEAGSTQIISNDLTLNCTGAAPNLLSLRSDVPNTQWNINPQGTRSVFGLDIQDSNNVNSTAVVLTARNVDSGNNLNWTFDTTAPVIVLDTVSSPSNNDQQPVTGSATEEIDKVSSVEFQVDSTNGSWSACTADDGAFNEAIESFTCTPGSTLTDGAQIIYVRTTDTNGNTTDGAYLATASFDVDITEPVLTESTAVTTPTLDTTPDYIFNTDESGTISYGGDCSSSDTTAVVGSNTITFATLASGTYVNCTITVTDPAGNASAHLSISAFTVDAPPAISAVTASVSSTGANVSWDTDENASSWVEYGLTNAYGASSTEKDTNVRVTSHSVSLSGLATCTTYHYRAHSKDSSLQESVSSDETFKTSGCPDVCADGDPDKPNLTEAIAESTSSIKIVYGDSEEEVDHYELRYGRSASSYEWEVDDIGGKEDEKFTIKELSPGTTYYFKIRAVNDCGESSWTSEVSARTLTAITQTEETIPTNEPVPVVQDTGPTAIESPETDGQIEDPSEFESAKDSAVAPSDTYSVSNIEMTGSGTDKKIRLSGKGPPNAKLTIYIYSSPLVLTVETDEDGNWSYVLDKELEDGEHEVYVAVTGSDGQIISKSAPVPFVKTAESITILPPAEASASSRAAPPVEKRQFTDFLLIVVIGIIALIVAVIFVGYMISRSAKKNNQQAY